MDTACFSTSFVPRFPQNQSATGHGRGKCVRRGAGAMPRAVAQPHDPRAAAEAEEIARITRRLEELRAQKAELERHAKQKKAEARPSRLHIGRHGEGSRFLSISTIDALDHYPRVVAVVEGDCNSISGEEVLSAPRLSDCSANQMEPEPGRLMFGTVPKGYVGRIMALPGAGVIANVKDAVAMAVRSKDVADALPLNEGDTVVLVVERDLNEDEFDERAFYVWKVAGKTGVKIGWTKELPRRSEGRAVGKVVCALVEEREERRKAKSCWEEENELF